MLSFIKLKEKIKKENENEYKKFIRQLEVDEINSSAEEIIIYTPNIFINNYLKRKYKKYFENFFKEENNIAPKIIFKVKDKQKNVVKNIINEKVEIKPLSLLPEYTFDNFVVGESNQFAFVTAKEVAKNPGKIYNPLFIYGGVGLGKTHLLQAIGNYLNKSKKVLYVTSEEFMNSFFQNMKFNTRDEFHKLYRNCDVLLIDDIQFLAGKEKTQEEFFHTFNELYSQKKQICLTADRAPKDIPDLVDRLRNRFEAGLIANIQPPEPNTKIAIIKKKCELNNIKLADEVIEFISIQVSNIREIEGIITKIDALSKIVGIKNINLEFVKQTLKEDSNELKEDIEIDDIIKLIAKEFNIKPSEITSKSKNRNIVKARRSAIYLARKTTKNSTHKIAKEFGLKDHSAVSHAIKSINKLIEKDHDFKIKLEELKNKIQK